ncbi:MAG: PHP domain-containing protein, partial [Bacilli bacterium]|nr:PHP domain-containing protein [Bacilli bacterium]
MAYIPLWVKTNYSLLSSLVAIDKLIQKAKQLQITSLAITDTNVLYGAMEFYQECQKNNIKP